jgi:hypothetical protein
MGFESIGKTLITIGLLLVLVGAGLSLLGRLGLGRLPGDILIRRGNFTFYFPIVTSIIASLILTLLFNLFFRR